MPTINAVGIISKPRSDLAARLVPELIAWLDGARPRRPPGYRNRAVRRPLRWHGSRRNRGQAPAWSSFSEATALCSPPRAPSAARGIPLFAVNLGGLGFLTAITVDEIYPQLERALRGDFRIAHRRMLECELWRGSDRLARYDALNDMVLTKSEIARMIDLEVQIDGHFVCVYRADGLIVATPTGSTAYSLSAGGPIVFPSVAALTVTPICPHTLTNRPVRARRSSVIEVINRSDDQATYLTIDGQLGELLRTGDRVVCRRSQHSISLIQPPDMMFFDVLREKLKWGGR